MSTKTKHKSYYLVEGLKKDSNGRTRKFSRYILETSAAKAKQRVKGFNKSVYKMDNSFKP